MKVSVCTDMIYSDIATPEAMEKIKAAGADAVEFWGAGNKDLNAIAEAGKKLGLPVAVFCAPGGSMIAPDSSTKYPETLKTGVSAADILGCRSLISCSGAPDWGWSPSEMLMRLRETVIASVPVLEENNLTMLLEPLNASEMSFLRSSGMAFDLCRMSHTKNVKVLFDLYHMQYMEGNLINTIRANLDLIGHFHVADLPNRTAPGLGEINFKNIFKAIKDGGYEGYVGLEYKPGSDRESELASVIERIKE
ncbi:MAG: TIM barrel protein [Lentisphaerae bacterium]|nr:TIM barrel protein [Lentisphaerota bacterium]